MSTDRRPAPTGARPAAAAAATGAKTTDVATRPAAGLPMNPELKEVRRILADPATKAQFLAALGERMGGFDHYMRVALSLLQRNPGLLKAERVSLLSALLAGAQLRLSFDPALGQAYVVPFKDGKQDGKSFVQLIVGYRGYIELMYRSGRVASVEAHVVYPNDDFRYEFGLTPKLHHVPAKVRQTGMTPDYVYGIVRLKDGQAFFDVMTAQEVELVKAHSAGARSGASPWNSDFQTDIDEMWRKTIIRRMAKTSPVSVDVQRAAVAEEYADAGVAMDLSGGVFDAEVDVESARAADATATRTGALREKYQPGAGEAAQTGGAPAVAPGSEDDPLREVEREEREERARQEAASRREPGEDG